MRSRSHDLTRRSGARHGTVLVDRFQAMIRQRGAQRTWSSGQPKTRSQVSSGSSVRSRSAKLAPLRLIFPVPYEKVASPCDRNRAGAKLRGRFTRHESSPTVLRCVFAAGTLRRRVLSFFPEKSSRHWRIRQDRACGRLCALLAFRRILAFSNASGAMLLLVLLPLLGLDWR